MQDIDFLPQRYREAHADRSSNVWRIVIVVVAAAVVSSTAAMQIRSRSQLREHVGLALANLQAIRGQSSDLPELERRMAVAEVESQLHTYLRHPWPRTQVLAALVRPLPATVALTSLKIERETGSTSSGPPSEQVALSGAAPSAAAPTRQPAQEDVEQLRKKYDAVRTVIHLAGQSDDAVALHRYLTELGRSELLVDPELLSVQAAEDESSDDSAETSRQASSRRQFSARVYLRPGFGQRNGPSADELAPAEPSESAAVAARPPGESARPRREDAS